MIQISPENFLESFPDGACLIGPDCRILSMNSRLIGTVGSVMGQSCHEALAGLPHVCPFCPFDDLVRGTADPISGAFQLRWARPYSVNVRLLPEAGEGGVILETVRDLTEDEQGQIVSTIGVSKDIGRESAVRPELELLNDYYRETIHFISHENKNSLVVIAGFVHRLLETETDPARRDQLAIVCHHSQFLEAMNRDLLVMADLEHGEFHIKKTLIRNFYEDVVLPAMIGLKERYPDSFKSYDESMGSVGAIQLMGDPSLLEVVYRNLFGNALKYRHPHGKIAYGVVERTDSYLFNVWNEGPGVPPDQVESIFEKFYRVQNDTTGEKPGTGLGLYNIRRIIEAHGGRIWCETKPGDWTNFLFILPKE